MNENQTLAQKNQQRKYEAFKEYEELKIFAVNLPEANSTKLKDSRKTTTKKEIKQKRAHQQVVFKLYQHLSLLYLSRTAVFMEMYRPTRGL